MGHPAVICDPLDELRYCSNCGKTENELNGQEEHVVLQLCGTCRTIRYCSAECQLVDWPVHRKTCNKKLSSPKKTNKANKVNIFRARFFGEKPTPVPTHAINAILQDWTTTYRALLAFTLSNASDPSPNQPPQVFYVKLSMPSEVKPEIKARAALRVDDAEVLTLEEFRRATVNKSHRLFSDENGQLLDAFNKHIQARTRIGLPGRERLTMVVQRLEAPHEGVSMIYFKSWYHDGEYPARSRLKDGAWLPYFKEKVAVGNGWQCGGV